MEFHAFCLTILYFGIQFNGSIGLEFNITGGVGWRWNCTIYVIQNSVTWQQAYNGCAQKNYELYSYDDTAFPYIANEIRASGIMTNGSIWVGYLLAQGSSKTFGVTSCDEFSTRVEAGSSYMCSAINIEDGTMVTKNCTDVNNFLCFKRGAKETPEAFPLYDLIYSTSLQKSEKACPGNSDCMQCVNECERSFTCVALMYEEINSTCTKYTDNQQQLLTPYLFEYSNVSVNVANESHLYVKPNNRVFLETLVENTTYSSIFPCEAVANETCVCTNYVCADSTVNKTTLIEEAKKVAAEIKKNLTVDAKTLSSYKRTKTCASDPRPSSAGIGAVWTAIIVILILVLVLSDIPTFKSHAPSIKTMKRMAKRCRKQNKISNTNNDQNETNAQNESKNKL